MEPLKNLFSVKAAERIAEAIRRGHPAFSEEVFLQGLAAELESRELKERVTLIADRIEAQLPATPPAAFAAMEKALARHDTDPIGLSGMEVWPLTEIVARRGMSHFEASMGTLHAMTSRFTAEFAIRPFLRTDPDRTHARLAEWIHDPDEHVRRLVSEGSRPFLPWGERLPAIQANPDLTLPLLAALRNDPSEYVRRSIANHLNDHSKTHPDRIVAVLGEWLRAQPNSVPIQRLVRHALRTLLKRGHPGALTLQGFAPPEAIKLSVCEIGTTSLRVGEALTYSFTLRNISSEPAKVLFDYAIHHQRANGTLSPKIFKGRTCSLAPGEWWTHTGQHVLRRVTTRRYYPGLHQFEARVNGRPGALLPFELLPD